MKWTSSPGSSHEPENSGAPALLRTLAGPGRRYWKLAFLCAITLPCAQARLQSAEESLKVIRVLDGDTFIVDAGDHKGDFQIIGLLGVDAPENSEPPMRSEPLGKEALEFTRDKLEGKRVVLEGKPAGPDTDRYGRSLRYVHVKDGALFNTEILEQGLARVAAQHAFARRSQFAESEQRARQAGFGIWRPAAAGPAAAGASAEQGEAGLADDEKPYSIEALGTPPPDVKVLRQVDPQFPSKARPSRGGGTTGNVILYAVVRWDGSVGDIVVVRSPGKSLGFDDASIEAVKQWRYRPVLKDGKGVNFHLFLGIGFDFG